MFFYLFDNLNVLCTLSKVIEWQYLMYYVTCQSSKNLEQQKIHKKSRAISKKKAAKKKNFSKSWSNKMNICTKSKYCIRQSKLSIQGKWHIHSRCSVNAYSLLLLLLLFYNLYNQTILNLLNVCKFDWGSEDNANGAKNFILLLCYVIS